MASIALVNIFTVPDGQEPVITSSYKSTHRILFSESGQLATTVNGRHYLYRVHEALLGTVEENDGEEHGDTEEGGTVKKA